MKSDRSTLKNCSIICSASGERTSVYSSEDDAMNTFGRLGLSDKTRDQHEAFYCDACEFWHVREK